VADDIQDTLLLEEAINKRVLLIGVR
jgi:hypothetical protein